jgi:hypothetical protein
MEPQSQDYFSEVQDRLAELLDMEAVPVDIWRELLQHHKDLVVHAHRGGEAEEHDLVRQAQSLYRVWSRRVGRMPPLGRGQKKEEVASHMSPLELERSAAFEEHLAKVVATDPKVRRFRLEVLNGRLLAPEDARVLLGSEAARFLRHGMFAKLGIPVLGHTSTLDDYRREDVRVEDSGTDLVRHLATVSVEPPGITETVRTLWPDPFVDLAFPTEDGYVDDREVWRQSLLGWLQELSEKLAETYRWFPSQVTWFLLTGEVPAAPPVRMRYWWNASPYHREGVVDMEVSLWVSADTVRDAFYALQRRALKEHDNRTIGEKNLKLLRFVTERMDEAHLLEQDVSRNKAARGISLATALEGVSLPQGGKLVAEWDNQDWVQQKQQQENKKRPKKKKQRWVYNGDTRRFWRDFRRAQRAVMVPPYERPDEL